MLALLGAALWPIGQYGFGGFDESTGAAIIGAGSVLVLGSFAAEFALRSRSRRRPTKRSSG